MNHLILTDVRDLIHSQNHIVISTFQEDPYYEQLLNQQVGDILFSFYHWAFKHTLHKSFGIQIWEYRNDVFGSHAFFLQVYDRIESVWYNFLRENLTSSDHQILTQAKHVQVVFNGQTLLLAPCYV